MRVREQFFRVAMNTYIPIFRGLDVCGGRKLQTNTHTGQLQCNLAVHMRTEG